MRTVSSSSSSCSRKLPFVEMRIAFSVEQIGGMCGSETVRVSCAAEMYDRTKVTINAQSADLPPCLTLLFLRVPLVDPCCRVPEMGSVPQRFRSRHLGPSFRRAPHRSAKGHAPSRCPAGCRAHDGS